MDKLNWYLRILWFHFGNGEKTCQKAVLAYFDRQAQRKIPVKYDEGVRAAVRSGLILESTDDPSITAVRPKGEKKLPLVFFIFPNGVVTSSYESLSQAAYGPSSSYSQD
jgi:hypothetical protein